MFLYDKDMERVMEAKKREILAELEATRTRIINDIEQIKVSALGHLQTTENDFASALQENALAHDELREAITNNSPSGGTSTNVEWDDIQNKPFGWGIGEIDFVPECVVMFNDGYAWGFPYESPHDLGLIENNETKPAYLVVDGEVIEGSITYDETTNVTLGTFANFIWEDGYLTNEEIENEREITVRAYMMGEKELPVPDKYLGDNIPKYDKNCANGTIAIVKHSTNGRASSFDYINMKSELAEYLSSTTSFSTEFQECDSYDEEGEPRDVEFTRLRVNPYIVIDWSSITEPPLQSKIKISIDEVELLFDPPKAETTCTFVISNITSSMCEIKLYNDGKIQAQCFSAVNIPYVESLKISSDEPLSGYFTVNY